MSATTGLDYELHPSVFLYGIQIFDEVSIGLDDYNQSTNMHYYHSQIVAIVVRGLLMVHPCIQGQSKEDILLGMKKNNKCVVAKFSKAS